MAMATKTATMTVSATEATKGTMVTAVRNGGDDGDNDDDAGTVYGEVT